MQDQHSRTFRFSLSRLLIAVFIVGVVMAVLSQYLLFKQRIAQQESDIRTLGGFIETYSSFGSPVWIRFDADIHATNGRIQDSDGEFLATLKRTKGINLNYTSIGDEMLEHLQKLQHLEWICLEETDVTQHGIKQLQAKLPNCRIYWKRMSTPRL